MSKLATQTLSPNVSALMKRSLVPMLVIGGAGAVQAALPATAAAAKPDLCYSKCSPYTSVWGAVSHARADAEAHGLSDVHSITCSEVHPNATRGHEQWQCYGKGYYYHSPYSFGVQLSPYGYSTYYVQGPA